MLTQRLQGGARHFVATLLRAFLSIGVLLPGALRCAADVALVPSHALWKYMDDGLERTDAWMSIEYDDASWANGFAPLGYGEPGVIITSTAAGSVVNYFRRSFQLATSLAAQNVLFRVWRDDIAKVFLNGNLIFDDVSRSGEWTPPYQDVWPSSELRLGSNIVAVEIRQVTPGSSDMVFDFELVDTNSVSPPPAHGEVSSPANNATVRIGGRLFGRMRRCSTDARRTRRKPKTAGGNCSCNTVLSTRSRW
jgi:hypothetical protein